MRTGIQVKNGPHTHFLSLYLVSIALLLKWRYWSAQNRRHLLVPHTELYTNDTLCEINARGLFLFSVQAGRGWTTQRRSPLAVFIPTRTLPGTTILESNIHKKGVFYVMHPFLDSSLNRHYLSWVKPDDELNIFITYNNSKNAVRRRDLVVVFSLKILYWGGGWLGS